jgi:hypothetical protein
VTLVTASNPSAPVETCYRGGRRVPPVLFDLKGTQHLGLTPPTRLLRLVHEGLLKVRKRTSQTRITRRSLDRVIDILPTETCQ